MRPHLPANIVRTLKRIPRLTVSEEHFLISRFRAGDRRARERLVLSQLRFVIKIARRYRRHGCPMSDLIQEGVVGLLEAIKRFNPERGTRLSTFAMWWIRSSIQDCVLRSIAAVRPVTTPQHRTMFFNADMWQLNERSDKAVRAVAVRLNTTMEDVRAFAQRIRMSDHAIDTVLGHRSSITGDLADRQPDQETVLASKRERIDLVRRLRASFPGMTKRERHILRRRFLGEKQHSRNKIGKELGLSKERVRQLELRAIQKLRSVGYLPHPVK